jgi:hypothetical protein
LVSYTVFIYQIEGQYTVHQLKLTIKESSSQACAQYKCQNTLLQILVIPVHTVTDESLLQEKALYNIVLTLLGILIDVKLLRSKARSLIVVTVLGIVTQVIV